MPQALVGGGEMGGRIREFDWSATSLGALETWPNSLMTALSLILGSQMPMWIGWGPECLFFYNDAYVQVLGHAKHSWALGRPAATVWAEIWDVCGPLAERVFRDGEAPFVEDVRLFMNRGDRLEEVYYSFSYSPIRDESGRVGGLFCPNTEVTSRLLYARRVRTLSELAAEALVEKTTAAACITAATTLAKNPDDVPFALLYLVDDGELRLEQAVHVASGTPLSPYAVATDAVAPWPFGPTIESGSPQVVEIAANEVLPLGLANQPVSCALAVPVTAAGHARPFGVLVAGVNPTRELDVEYRTFYDLVAAQIGTAIQNAVAAEQERRRADMLAELDRAKTTFFSNVSHEFRTPLTLMIGPTEDALASPERALKGEALETVYRNELRLLKLVGALLDFSRLEAGRMVASYEAVDLAALTVDLASSFRSAIERAGLVYEVDAPPLPRLVPVDRDMWEKIVLNLLSNALKFTLQGTIRVGLHMPDDEWVELVVADTGIGIAAEEMPRLFERFRRIENARARTHEGSGIGLALVDELVRLHGGTVTATSEVDRGTTFRVRVPVLDARVVATTSRARAASLARAAYSDEFQARPAATSGEAAPTAARVLLADDNADMRDYLRRLLAEHWRVTVVADGVEAVEAALCERPDLVLTDVMMPGLDGFGVLAALRGDERTRRIPVIMLSARAGDEARVEGLDAGADDYLVKPFSARELIARVRTHLALAQLRREMEHQHAELFALFMQVPAAIAVRRGPDLRCVFQNEASLAIRKVLGETARESWGDQAEASTRIYEQVIRTGQVHVEPVAVTDTWDGEHVSTRHWQTTYAPLRRADGTPDGVVTLAVEVTDRKRVEEELRTSEERVRLAVENAAMATWDMNLVTGSIVWSDTHFTLLGYDPQTDRPPTYEKWFSRVHPDDREAVATAFERSKATESGRYSATYRIIRADTGELRWLTEYGRYLHDERGAVVRTVGIFFDATERIAAEEALREADRRKDEFLATLAHELRNPLAPIRTGLQVLRMAPDGRAAARAQEMMERQLGHMVRLIDDLLDISRISRGKVDLRRERIELRTAIEAALETSRPAIEAGRHALSVALPDEPIWLYADLTRLAQVIGNVLTNAAKYTPDGGRLAVAVAREGDEAVVKITDTGLGIPRDMIARVFEMFAQVNRTLDRAQGGLGIGLALVKRLVEMHGGTITASSPGPGRGSTFTIRLPVARAPSPATGHAPADDEDARARPCCRVLVVDDNRDAADSLADALTLAGHTTHTAYGGAEALAAAATFRPQVVLCDLGMPRINGFEVARALRADPALRRAVLVALTGWGAEDDKRRARAAGYDFHLTKPIEIEQVTKLLAELTLPADAASA